MEIFQDVARSRGVYLRAKLVAIERPTELLVIAIDGSDQSSYSLPYFKQVKFAVVNKGRNP